MHAWLLQAPLLGSVLKDFQEHQVVPLRAKITAIALLWPSIIYAIYRVQTLPLTIMLGAIGIAVTVYLFWLPSTYCSENH